MKKIAIILGSIILLAFLTAYFTINTIVKNQIVMFATKELKAEVELGSANVSFFPIGLKLNDLEVEKDDPADPLKKLELEEIEVSIDHNSIFTDTIVINYIKIDEPEISFAVAGLGLGDLSKKAAIGYGTAAILGGPVTLGLSALDMGYKQLKKKKEADAKAAKESAKPANPNAKNFVIKKLYIKEAQFIPADEVLWIGKGREIKLPDIELENISKSSGKAIFRQVMAIVTKAVVKELMKIKLGNIK
jgi:hypothetical protein